MTDVWLDVETISAVPVTSYGLYRHAADPDLDITAAAWAIDEGPLETWWETPLKGSVSSPPKRLHDLMTDPEVIFWAHNAAYERITIRHAWGVDIPPERWRCTSVLARWYNLPAGLDQFTGYMLGKKLKKHSISNSTKALWNTASLPWGSDETNLMVQEMVPYCARDVESMRAAALMLPPLPDQVWEEYAVSERINDRGVAIDIAFAEQARDLRQVTDAETKAELARLTDNAVSTPRGPAARVWMEKQLVAEGFEDLLDDEGQLTRGFKKRRTDRVGFYTEQRPTFDKHMRQGLRDELNERSAPHHLLEVLDCIDEGQNAAVTKYTSTVNRISPDDRLRGMYIFAGAGQTHRFSSTGVQTHNLLRDTLDLEDDMHLREVMTRDAPMKDRLAALRAGSLLDKNGLGRTLGMGLRGTLKAEDPDTQDLYWADWSAIEARALPWLAGDTRKLEMFRKGIDVYIQNAAGLYDTPASEVDKGQRQVGKVCLAADTEVLVKTPLNIVTTKPICNVDVADLTWDGYEWTRQSGPVHNGDRECVTLSGMKLTPDHLIWCGASTGWMPAAEVALNENMVSLALATASDSLLSQGICSEAAGGLVPSSCSATADGQSIGWIPTTSCGGPASAAVPAPRSKAQTPVRKSISNTLAHVLTLIIDAAYSTASQLFRTAATAPVTVSGLLMAGAASSAGGRMSMEMSVSGVHRDPGVSRPSGGSMTCWRIWSRLTGGMTRALIWTASTTRQAMLRAIFGSSHATRTASTSETPTSCQCASSNSKQSLPVYDLINAGPRNRFTVITDEGPMIVHNCELALGYGGGKGAFNAMARGYGVSLTDDRVKQAVSTWRAANPVTVEYWTRLEDAAYAAMHSPCEPQHVGQGVAYIFAPNVAYGALLVALPCGSMLVYPHARIEEVERFENQPPEPAICFDHPSFGRTALWHGILVENITQAVCASLLREALGEADLCGHAVVAHTHDELVAETHTDDVEEDLYDLIKIMEKPPHWAEGLPLAAEGGIGSRYKIEDAAY